MASSESERRQFYADIVTAAVEGGIGYWSKARSYRWFSPDLAGGTAEPGPNGTANAWAVIVPADEEAGFADWPAEKDGVPTAEITVASVRRAIGKIAHGEYTDLRADIIATVKEAYREWDASDIDAEIADCIVQVAVFGKVVFS